MAGSENEYQNEAKGMLSDTVVRKRGERYIFVFRLFSDSLLRINFPSKTLKFLIIVLALITKWRWILTTEINP